MAQTFKTPADQANDLEKQYDVYLKAGDKKPAASFKNDKEATDYIRNNGGAGQIDVVKAQKSKWHPSVKDQLDFYLNAGWRDDPEIEEEDRNIFEGMSLKDYLEYMDDDRHPEIKTEKDLWDMEDAYLASLGYDVSKLTGLESTDELKKLLQGRK